MIAIHRLATRIAVALGLAVAAAGAAQAAGPIGTTFPADFPVAADDSTLQPWIGFGAAGAVKRTPVIFLHGNNDTPFATNCSSSHYIQAMAQYFSDNGYAPSELWALGYQGEQCDLIDFGSANRSSLAHTNAANVPDLRRFVRAVQAYTGASKVDIVAHGLGVTLAREWVRQDDAEKLVRRFVAIEGPNQGMIICSAAPGNPWALAFAGGYTPSSPVCQELGSPDTLFLRRLNRSTHQIDPSNTLVIRNLDQSCLFKLPDGFGCAAFGPTPALDSFANPTDFSASARISRARDLGLSGQVGYAALPDTSAHIGIAYSPATRQAAFAFLTRR